MDENQNETPRNGVNLNDKTTIPLWAAFTVFPPIAGLIFSSGIIWSKVQTNSETIPLLRADITQIKNDVSFMKGKMENFSFIFPKPETDTARAWCKKKSDDET